MKLSGKTAERFLSSPDKTIAAVLLYGPDLGLIKERADALTKLAAGALDDPFRVALLTAKSLAEDPARLADEAMAQSLTGGRRAIRIADADDKLTDLLKEFLATAAGDALVVLEAEELGPRSSLRRLFEGAERGAALACYRDEGEGLANLIRQKLQQEGFSIAGDALTYLAQRLGGDRAVTLSELEKLALYMGAERKGQRVELADAEACIGDSAALALDDLIYAIADGDQKELERNLSRNLSEGVSPISMLRAVARHFLRLHAVMGGAAAGQSVETLVKALRPPIFFRYEPRFKAQLRRWTPARLAEALELLLAAERDAKSGYMPSETIGRRALAQIAAMAGRGR